MIPLFTTIPIRIKSPIIAVVSTVVDVHHIAHGAPRQPSRHVTRIAKRLQEALEQRRHHRVDQQQAQAQVDQRLLLRAAAPRPADPVAAASSPAGTRSSLHRLVDRRPVLLRLRQEEPDLHLDLRLAVDPLHEVRAARALERRQRADRDLGRTPLAVVHRDLEVAQLSRLGPSSPSAACARRRPQAQLDLPVRRRAPGRAAAPGTPSGSAARRRRRAGRGGASRRCRGGRAARASPRRRARSPRRSPGLRLLRVAAGSVLRRCSAACSPSSISTPMSSPLIASSTSRRSPLPRHILWLSSPSR
jgi:hypothetical protein